MSVSLEKGGNVSLLKEEPGLTKIVIGLGWDVRATDGAQFDLDASVFLLKEDGKVRKDTDFIFYNHKMSDDGSVVHNGDNLTGQGDGDDETITVDLMKLPADVSRISCVVTIHEADKRGQNFGQVNNAFIRVMNSETGREIARYDLTEDASLATAMIFGEIYRRENDWKFKSIAQGFKGGLKPLAESFGINIG